MAIFLQKFFIRIFILSLFINNCFAQTDIKVEFAIDQLHEFQNVRDFCISNNNDEIFFTLQSPFQEVSQILTMKKTNGKWSKPQLMIFSSKFSDLEPFLSPDQTRLYFASNRPIDDHSDTAKDYDIWFVSRKNIKDEWSEPIRLDAPVNTENNEFYPSVSLSNNLYFTSDAPNGIGKDDIYVAKYKNGIYEIPQLLDSNINSAGYEFNAFVSQNENFIIFTKYNSEDGIGSGDLYIATKDEHSQWTKAKNLGNIINTKWMEYCPYYDAINGVLYFTSKRNNLQPIAFKDVKEMIQYIQGNENGLSKIYKVKLELP